VLMPKAGPVAGFPQFVLGAKNTGHVGGACAANRGGPSRRHPQTHQHR